jgi:hypothetical protein
MARLEALIAPVVDGEPARGSLAELAGLQAAVPGARVLFHSNRDGPLHQVAAA